MYAELTPDAALGSADRNALHFEAVRRLATVPGVTGASVVEGMPFGAHNIPPISVPGLAEPPSTGRQLPILYAATPDFLRMMDVRLHDGRLLTARDTRTSPLVVLVNESFARGAWPNERAIGKCIRAGFDPSAPAPPGPMAPATLPCREVVGVVRDSRARSLQPDGGEASLMQYYVPFEQVPGGPFGGGANAGGILVQTAGEAVGMIAAVRRDLQASTVPVSARVREYQSLIDPQLRNWRLGATLFTAFGAVALGIAAVGLFGVVSYIVAQRRREIGVRLALGGTSARIGREVLADALRLSAGGVVVGLVSVLACSSFVQPMLFQTSARDPAIVLGAGAVLLAITLLAALRPAWSAATVHPAVALRAD